MAEIVSSRRIDSSLVSRGLEWSPALQGMVGVPTGTQLVVDRPAPDQPGQEGDDQSLEPRMATGERRANVSSIESEELTRIEPPFRDLPRFPLDLSDPEVSRDAVRLLLHSDAGRERCTTVSAA
jgi:hypothetical protein